MSIPRSKFSKPAKSRLGPVKTPGLDANKSRLGPAKTPGLDANKSRLGPVKPVGTAAKAKIKKPAFVAKPAKPNAGVCVQTRGWIRETNLKNGQETGQETSQENATTRLKQK